MNRTMNSFGSLIELPDTSPTTYGIATMNQLYKERYDELVRLSTMHDRRKKRYIDLYGQDTWNHLFEMPPKHANTINTRDYHISIIDVAQRLIEKYPNTKSKEDIMSAIYEGLGSSVHYSSMFIDELIEATNTLDHALDVLWNEYQSDY